VQGGPKAVDIDYFESVSFGKTYTQSLRYKYIHKMVQAFVARVFDRFSQFLGGAQHKFVLFSVLWESFAEKNLDS
jgi:hypothetical protein